MFENRSSNLHWSSLRNRSYDLLKDFPLKSVKRVDATGKSVSTILKNSVFVVICPTLQSEYRRFEIDLKESSVDSSKSLFNTKPLDNQTTKMKTYSFCHSLSHFRDNSYKDYLYSRHCRSSLHTHIIYLWPSNPNHYLYMST
jgi:hypothetical protein